MIRAPSRAKLRYNPITLLLSIQILLYIKTGHVESKHVMVNLHSSQVCLLIVVLIDLETVRERHPRWPAWWFEQCADEFEGGGYWYEQGGWEVSIYLSLPGFYSKMWSFDEQLQCYLVQCGAWFVTLIEEMCYYLLQASPWCRASQQWHSRAQQPSTWGKLAWTKIASQMIPAYHHLFNLIMANAWSVHIVVKTLTCAQLPQSFDLKYKFM